QSTLSSPSAVLHTLPPFLLLPLLLLLLLLPLLLFLLLLQQHQRLNLSAMYILHDTTDNGTAGKDAPRFDDRIVQTLLCFRTGVFNKNATRNYVKTTDGEQTNPPPPRKNWSYKHHVPHIRILKAIETKILGKTRLQALRWLMDVAKVLGIRPDEQLVKRFKYPPTNRVDYETWADWCIGSICDWKENIFYGPGTGDHRGTHVDYPDGGARSSAQLSRVAGAAEALRNAIPGLSIEEVVKHTSEEVSGKRDKGLKRTFVESEGEPWYKPSASMQTDDDDSDYDSVNADFEKGLQKKSRL
ncbi:hypothetical protein B0T16DRAFT_245756, partial [Cercophora newfieldiana]